MQTSSTKFQSKQSQKYCMHCLRDIFGQPVVVREKVSYPGFPAMYATRYLHEECAVELERQAREDEL